MMTLKLARSFLVLFAVAGVGLAHAQWSWKDKDGRRIYSDQPPPPAVPDADILKRPGGMKTPANTAAAQKNAGPTPTGAPEPTGAARATPTAAVGAAARGASAPTGKDSELEKRKKEAESKEIAKEKAQEKAQEQKDAASRKDNCARATRAKSTMDSGERVAQRNDKGEREFMSDAARAAESKRLADVMASECK
jgi:type IV secretory pathway VirB10-like protein